MFVYMQLATYIQDLLYRYECVIVPGFGAFLTQYRSAIIEQETHRFHPPGKTLSFNRQLQSNDGLLANYVASVENCSYEIALQKIRNFAGTISLKLSEGETVAFKKIGDFHLNEEQALQFAPVERENYSTSSFGLSSFMSPAINREYLISELSEESTPFLFTPEKKNGQPYLKYAAIALIAISVSGFAGMKLYEGNIQKYNFAEKEKATDLLENQIQEATFVIEDPLPAIKLTIPKQAGNYHLVAGAFRFKENADKKIYQLTAKGYTARSIGQNKYGLHQVIYGSYQSSVEALEVLRSIRKTDNADAWLLVQKLSD